MWTDDETWMDAGCIAVVQDRSWRSGDDARCARSIQSFGTRLRQRSTPARTTTDFAPNGLTWISKPIFVLRTGNLRNFSPTTWMTGPPSPREMTITPRHPESADAT